MDLSQLLQFQKVAELEHMTQAAFALHVAQPALSRTIKSLEKELGLQLFDRENKSLHLNENGRILLRYVQQMSACLQEMRQEAEKKNAIDRNTIRILLRSIPPSLLPLMQGFRQLHPETHFKISSYVENAVIRDEQYDFQLGIQLRNMEKSCYLPLIREELVAAISLQHPLSQQAMTDYFQSIHFQPTSLLKCTDSQSMCGLVEENMGIGITIRSLWNGSAGRVALLPIEGPQYQMEIDFVWKKDRELSPVCQAFLEYIKASR